MLPDDLQRFAVPPSPLISDEYGFSGFVDDMDGLPLFPSLAPDRIVISFYGGGDRTTAFLKSGRRIPKAAQDFYSRLATVCLLAGHRPVAIRPIFFGSFGRKLKSRILVALGTTSEKYGCRLILPELPDVQTDKMTIGALVFAEKDTYPAFFSPSEGDIIVAAADSASFPVLPVDGQPEPYTNWGEKLHKVRTGKYPTKQRVIRFASRVDEFTMAGLRGAVVPRVPGMSVKIASKRLHPLAGKAGIIVIVAPHFAKRVQKRLSFLNRKSTVSIIGKLLEKQVREG